MKFTRRIKSQLPAISTASLPDIVFILLFFFMTVTTMKNTNLLVENVLPNASETEELSKTDRVIEIVIGKPLNIHVKSRGEAPRIQLDGQFGQVKDIGSFILSSIDEMPEDLRAMAMVSLKVDKNVGMGIVADVKEELRKVQMLKVNYTTFNGDALKNF